MSHNTFMIQYKWIYRLFLCAWSQSPFSTLTLIEIDGLPFSWVAIWIIVLVILAIIILNLKVVLNCIFLMMKDVEPFFKFFSVIWVSSFVNNLYIATYILIEILAFLMFSLLCSSYMLFFILSLYQIVGDKIFSHCVACHFVWVLSLTEAFQFY